MMAPDRTTHFVALATLTLGALCFGGSGCGPLEPTSTCGPIANGTASTSYGLKDTGLGGGNGRLANKFYWATSGLNIKQVDVKLLREGELDNFNLTLAIHDDNGSGTQPSPTTQFSHSIVLHDDDALGVDISKTEFEWVSFTPGCYADLEKHTTLDPHIYWLTLSADYSTSTTDQINWGAAVNSSNPVAAFKEFNAFGWQLFDYPTNTGSQDFLFRFTCIDTSDPADAALLACP